MATKDVELTPPDGLTGAENLVPQPLSYEVNGRTRSNRRVPFAAKTFFVIGVVILAIAALPLCGSLTTEYSADRAPLARLAAALAIPGALAFGAGLFSIWMRRSN